MRAVPARTLLAGLAAALAGCTAQGGVGGVEGGPVPTAAPVPGSTAGPTTTGQPAPTGSPGPSATSTSTSNLPSTTATAGRLLLGGRDLGVTRVGAPFRDAVAAVTGVLGRPVGDPAPDTACIGAEDEASWASFRLAGTGGVVSGWLSTSRTVATPAAVTVGTTLAALRRAYGPRLEVRAPAPDGQAVFVVADASLGGTLSGPHPTDAVTALFNGTCEAG